MSLTANIPREETEFGVRDGVFALNSTVNGPFSVSKLRFSLFERERQTPSKSNEHLWHLIKQLYLKTRGLRWNRLVNVVWKKSLNKGVILLLQDPADLEQSQIATGEHFLSVLLKTESGYCVLKPKSGYCVFLRGYFQRSWGAGEPRWLPGSEMLPIMAREPKQGSAPAPAALLGAGCATREFYTLYWDQSWAG